MKRSDLLPPGCIAVPPSLSISCHSALAPADPVRGPAGAEQTALLGKGFILQAMEDILFLWVLKNIATSRHSEDVLVPTWEYHQLQGLSPDPGASLLLVKESLLKMQATAVHFWANAAHFFWQNIVWAPATLTSLVGCWACELSSAICAQTCDCTLVPHEHLFAGWGPPKTHPRHAAFIWFICVFYTTYGIHICNVAVALPSPMTTSQCKHHGIIDAKTQTS